MLRIQLCRRLHFRERVLRDSECRDKACVAGLLTKNAPQPHVVIRILLVKIYCLLHSAAACDHCSSVILTRHKRFCASAAPAPVEGSVASSAIALSTSPACRSEFA